MCLEKSRVSVALLLFPHSKVGSGSKKFSERRGTALDPGQPVPKPTSFITAAIGVIDQRPRALWERQIPAPMGRRGR